MAAPAVVRSGSLGEGGCSELLRGIPNFRKTPIRAVKQAGAVNPVPASIRREGAAPKNGHELARELRRRADAVEKVRWLAEIPEAAFASIFRVEIDAELLQAILTAMHTAVCGTDALESNAAEQSQQVLVTLVRECPRALSFAAGFAGAKEQKRTEELLKALEAAASDSSSLLSVRAALIGAGD